MSWVTVIWSMIASACLTMAAIHVLVPGTNRTARASRLFALVAAGLAAFAGVEVWMMRAETPQEFGTALRWAHLPTWIIVVGMVIFVRNYLGAGRRWLAWAVCGLRTLALLVNFLVGANLNYRVVTGLRPVSFLGESVSIPEGVANPWMLVGQASLVLFWIYVADASIAVWRRGDRQHALVVGGSMVFFTMTSVAQSVVVLWGIKPWPLTASLCFLPVIVAMAYELSLDLFRARRLSVDLRESEQRMALAAAATNLGFWLRDPAGREIWANDNWRALLGFSTSEPLDLDLFFRRVHPDDREAVGQTFAKALRDGDHYDTEYRVVLPDGQVRWIASRGRAESDGAGKLVVVRGVSLEITTRKQAEEAAHNLSGRLIHAQEEERARLARELHDDLSQSLALLSVELDLFGQRPPSAPDQITTRMQELSARVKDLSSEVHRLSHELHPAKLEQLGLAAAVRGFCKELSVAHHLAIEFKATDVPRALPNEVALCLYRIAQEGLQNVVKHSGAVGAQVALAATENEIRLSVVDDGAGFDAHAIPGHGSLGLVSMRERVRLVRGRLTVESKPGEGTKVEVRVPLALGACETVT